MIVGDTLYKRTSTGAVQVWRQEINDEETAFRTVSGQKDGQLVTSEWTFVVSKNIGRSNETTPQQQTKLEVGANYTKKLAQGGYKSSEEDIDTKTFFSPMLAKNFSDYEEELRYEEWWVGSQPKLDGVRCIFTDSGAWTRQGKPILNVQHIADYLAPLFDESPGLILDGELYNHSLKEDFNKIVSLVKKQKPTDADRQEARGAVQYWVYDVPSIPGSFKDRWRAALSLLLPERTHPVIMVPTNWAYSRSELDTLYESYLADGYEGQIVRDGRASYENKRTKALLKRKEWMDEEFTILRIEDGIGNRAGMAGRVVVALPNGGEANPNPKGDRAFLRALLQNKDVLVGVQATVEFFGYTPDGSLRFPRVTKVHDGGKI